MKQRGCQRVHPPAHPDSRAIKAHFEKEQALFGHGIKVLSLFFIDTVAKYRHYDDAGEQPGEYAQMFEEEYNAQLNEVLTLRIRPTTAICAASLPVKLFNGYFSIDKKTQRLVDPETGKSHRRPTTSMPMT